MTLADVTFYLFSLFNGLRVFSYLPQIYRVAHDEHGATAISYWTWGLWTAANASTGVTRWYRWPICRSQRSTSSTPSAVRL
jgi:hypothetical protein